MSENGEQSIDSAFKILNEAVDFARSLSDDALSDKIAHLEKQIQKALDAIAEINYDELPGVFALRGDIFAFAAEIQERTDNLKEACIYGRAAISEMQNCYAIIRDKNSLEALIKTLIFQLSRNLSFAVKLNQNRESMGLREENTLILGTLEHFLKIAEKQYLSVFDDFRHFVESINQTKMELELERLPYFTVSDIMQVWPFDNSGLSLSHPKPDQLLEENNPQMPGMIVLDAINDEFELLEDTFEEAFEEGSKIETQIEALKALCKKIPKDALKEVSGLSLYADIEFSIGKYLFAMNNHNSAIKSFRVAAKCAFHAFHLFPADELVPRMFEIMIAIVGSAREMDNIDEIRVAGGTALSLFELLKTIYSPNDLEAEIAICEDLSEGCLEYDGECEIWYPSLGAEWPFDDKGFLPDFDDQIISPEYAPAAYSPHKVERI